MNFEKRFTKMINECGKASKKPRRRVKKKIDTLMDLKESLEMTINDALKSAKEILTQLRGKVAAQKLQKIVRLKNTLQHRQARLNELDPTSKEYNNASKAVIEIKQELVQAGQEAKRAEKKYESAAKTRHEIAMESKKITEGRGTTPAPEGKKVKKVKKDKATQVDMKTTTWKSKAADKKPKKIGMPKKAK